MLPWSADLHGRLDQVVCLDCGQRRPRLACWCTTSR